MEGILLSLADRIKNSRKQRGYTQKDLAKVLSVKPATVSAWEVGRNEPSIDMLKKLSDVLGVSFEYLTATQKTRSNKDQVDLKDDPVVLSYGGKPVSDEDMDVIKAILSRHQND